LVFTTKKTEASFVYRINEHSIAPALSSCTEYTLITVKRVLKSMEAVLTGTVLHAVEVLNITLFTSRYTQIEIKGMAATALQ